MRSPDGLDSVVVATDFSANAERALSRVALLPLVKGARVLVAHALREGLPRRLKSTALGEAQRRLTGAAKALAGRVPEASVKPALLQGEPLAEIDRLVRNVSPDVLVLGRHGERPVADQLLGTLAEGLVRVAEPPVLVVTLRPTRPWQRVMVASEGTPDTVAVMHQSLRLAPGPLERADLVHAYHVPFERFLARDLSAEERHELRAAYQAKANAELMAAVAACPEVPWRKTLRSGDPRLVLMEQVHHRRTELLSVGSHRRSWLGASLLGSVAQWVVRSARCDVLVVPTLAVSAG